MADIEILSPSEFRALSTPTPIDIDAVERRVERLAILMDSAFRIPGTGIRFGADNVLGLIPGVGDVAAFGVSAYVVYEAPRLGAPQSVLGRMAANVAVDTVVGSIPIVGDLFDVAFKANRRNVDLLRGHIRMLRSDRARPVSEDRR